MNVDTITSSALFYLLKINKIRVSCRTITNLINNTPLLDSIRGVSDVLDALRVEHVVAKINYDQLCSINSPVIGAFNFDNEPYCVIVNANSTQVTIRSILNRKNITLSKNSFENYWSNTVIAVEKSEDYKKESKWRYAINSLIGYIERHLIAIILSLLFAMFMLVCVDNFSAFKPLFGLAVTKIVGITLSIIVIYKTLFDDKFLNKLCKIGSTIDCNSVLKSKASKIFNWIGLGEASLVYFLTTFLWCLFKPIESITLLSVFSFVAIGFVLFSIAWQFIVMKKICVLCMLINLVLLSDFIIVFHYFDQIHYANLISLTTLWQLLLFPLVLFVVKIIIASCVDKRKLMSLQRKNMHFLLNDKIFRCLLANSDALLPASDVECISDGNFASERVLSIITNPSCAVCRELHRELSEVINMYNVRITFAIFPNDTKGECVVLTILTIYQTKGWTEACRALEQWFVDGTIDQGVIISENSRMILKNHMAFCAKNKLKSVPLVAIDNHILDCELYPLNELKYLL